MNTVLVPDHVWASLLEQLARHGPSVERVAYLDGFIIDHAGYPEPRPQVSVVTAVTIPKAVLTAGNYHVPAPAMAQAGAHLRERRMVRLAQVHSHGNDWVRHSDTDDARAYSQQPGAISIVLPWHGQTRPAPDECGVHIRTPDGWQRLEAEHVAEVITLAPSLYDHRDPSCLMTPSRTTGIFSRLQAWLTRMTRRFRPESS